MCLPDTNDARPRFREGKFWGATVPSWRGMHCGAMLDAAADGALDLFYIIGGNFLETMPDPARMGRDWPGCRAASTRTFI